MCVNNVCLKVCNREAMSTPMGCLTLLGVSGKGVQILVGIHQTKNKRDGVCKSTELCEKVAPSRINFQRLGPQPAFLARANYRMLLLFPVPQEAPFLVLSY